MKNKKSKLTFAEFSRKNRKRSAKNFPECQSWIVSDWSNALAGETGEACNLIKKMRRGATIDPKDGTPIKLAIAKELADNIMYVDLLAEQIGFKLEDLVKLKFNEVSERIGSKIFLK